MHFIIHSTLCGTFDSSSTFRTIVILHFALGSWGNVGPSLMFYICQLIDTTKIEIKSECFRVLSACRRVTAALPDPALVSSGGGSVIGVFSTVFSFIPYHSWGRELQGPAGFTGTSSNPGRHHPLARRKIPGMHLRPQRCWPQCRECSQWTLTRLPR